MGIVKTEIVTIANFLQNKHLKIPDFQRPYKWTVRNVIQLLDDIQRFKGNIPYRIGTIVIYKENEEYKIVDGQQRTITFLLIVKCILAYKLDQLVNNDLKLLLSCIKDTPFNSRFSSEISQKNIQDNYREIERRIVNVDEGFIDFFLNRCEITHFVIDDISEAFQFFDSQNARGKDLEPHDLLKAFHLRELKFNKDVISEKEVSELVNTWEEMSTKELSSLFADFLFRIRGWSKGNSSRYFTKKDTPLFKGINLGKNDHYPYTQIYRLVDDHINAEEEGSKPGSFPFQLDQTIINGKNFFQMISHYKKVYDQIATSKVSLSQDARKILTTLDTYEGRNRTGDKFVRMLFNCSLLYYIDKFGEDDLSKVIEKIFIWAYSLRLVYQSLQLASVDNYVVYDFNMFKKIREAIFKEDIITLELPLINEDYESDKTAEIKELFIKMRYYANTK